MFLIQESTVQVPVFYKPSESFALFLPFLTPRWARCSTPPALKARFSTGGVSYGRRGAGIIGPLAGVKTSLF